MTEQKLSRQDYSKLSRKEKLYVLSQICIINNVTPYTPGYVGLIIRACTAKLGVSKEQAQSYSDDLKSAYDADQWTGLAESHQPDDEPETETTSTPRTFEAKTPTLNALKNLNYQSSVPIKHIEIPYRVQTDDTPANQAEALMQTAAKQDFNDVGHLTLAEAREQLKNPSLQLRDIVALLQQYYPATEIETRPRNLILIYLKRKHAIRSHRDKNIIIPPRQALIQAHKEDYYLEPPMEKYFTAGDRVSVGEVYEEE